MSHETLAGDTQHEIEVKRSRFLALAHPVESIEQALAWIDQIRVIDATHNCWALRVGETYRSSDDGEPGGSAGRPILAAIDGSGLDGVAVVVVRWYGGTKLGVGGLIRAYGGAAAECLRQAPRRQVLEMQRARINAPFEHSGAVYNFCSQHQLSREAETHTPHGLSLTVSLVKSELSILQDGLRDATRGQANLQPLDEPER